MAHIFDVMSTVNGQLNILAKDYAGQGPTRHLNNVPDFVIMAVNRAIDTNTSLLIESEKNASIEKPILGSTGDHYSPVYLGVVNNISTPIVDKVPIMANYKDAHGPGTAYIVGVPKKLFDPETTAEEVSTILRNIYFPLLNMDKEMEYAASPATLIIHNKPGVNIKTYDLTMTLVAIGCMYVNVRNWFVTDTGSPVDATLILPAFPEFEKYNAKSVEDGIVRTLGKYGKNINDLRDAVANGKLVRVFMYED